MSHLRYQKLRGDKKVSRNDLAKYMKILDENAINFSFGDFLSEFNQRFTLSGGYVDTEINQQKLESFLKEKEESLSYLAMCHIKKINQHKSHLS